MRALLLLLSCILAAFASDDQWVPLKMMVWNDEGQFHETIQKPLQHALKWFENAIRVKKLTAPNTLAKLSQHVSSYSVADTVTVQTSDKLFGFNLIADPTETQKLIDAADMVIMVVEKEESICKSTSVLASCQPFIGDGSERPYAAKMEFCYKILDEKKTTWFDTFRHELLHGLGFGTFDNSRFQPPPMTTYDWEFADGTTQPANRYSMQFTSPAVIKAVQDHFNCQDPSVTVESERGAQHLNEYLFGNELMTPSIHNVENFFSYISAALLEETYLGAAPWYQVNRTFIAPEAEAYSHFKGTGCDLLLKSCHVYLKNNAKPGEILYPFCTGKEGKDVCYDLASGARSAKYECTHDNLLRGNLPADNGITEPLNSIHHFTKHRFCPVFMQIGQYINQKAANVKFC